MQGAGLLKWFLDVFGRLMSQTERNAAKKILRLRRIIKAARDRGLHPDARLLRGAKDRIARILSEQRAVFRISDKQTPAHILPRKIRRHVELALISRRCNRLGNTEQLQLVAQFRIAAPSSDHVALARSCRALEFDRFQFEQERREAIRRQLRLALNNSCGPDRSRARAEFLGKLQPWRVASPKIVNQKERGTRRARRSELCSISKRGRAQSNRMR